MISNGKQRPQALSWTTQLCDSTRSSSLSTTILKGWRKNWSNLRQIPRYSKKRSSTRKNNRKSWSKWINRRPRRTCSANSSMKSWWMSMKHSISSSWLRRKRTRCLCLRISKWINRCKGWSREFKSLYRNKKKVRRTNKLSMEASLQSKSKRMTRMKTRRKAKKMRKVRQPFPNWKNSFRK